MVAICSFKASVLLSGRRGWIRAFTPSTSGGTKVLQSQVMFPEWLHTSPVIKTNKTSGWSLELSVYIWTVCSLLKRQSSVWSEKCVAAWLTDSWLNKSSSSKCGVTSPFWLQQKVGKKATIPKTAATTEPLSTICDCGPSCKTLSISRKTSVTLFYYFSLHLYKHLQSWRGNICPLSPLSTPSLHRQLEGGWKRQNEWMTEDIRGGKSTYMFNLKWERAIEVGKKERMLQWH